MRISALLLITLILSCKTNTVIKNKPDSLKVWKIEKLQYKDVDYIPNVYKSAFIVYSSNKKKVSMNLTLSDRAISELQVKWYKNYKNINLEKLSILKEFEYIQKGQNIHLKSVRSDYIAEGDNTEGLNKKLSDIVYDQSIGESPGLIGMLLEIKYPSVLSDIADINLYEDKPYKINIINEKIIISGPSTMLELLYKESYQWIGY